jgi:CRP-like cAMP-binding protein
VMYVIQDGNVKILKETDAGNVVVARLGPGDFLGEMALFDRHERSATAVAIGEARILTVDRKKLFATIDRDPTLAFRIIETLCRRIRKLNDEIGKLAKPQGLFDTCFNLASTCQALLEEARKFIKADNGSVMILNDRDELVIHAAFGKEAKQKAALAPGKGIAGDVVKSCRAELVNNVVLDDRFVEQSLNIRSLLCVPLKFENQAFGVINMSNDSERIFSLDDLKMLNSLSVYGSVAAHNAINYSALKEMANEVLLRHATVLNS